MSNLALKIENLQVSYGYINAVKGISIEVAAGQIIALLGANGAGKTSTMRAISGVIPSIGTISFFGEDIRGVISHKIAKKGLLQSPEGRHVFKELTVEENLLAGAFTAGKRNVKQNLERVHKYFPVLKERGRQVAQTLSGGEQQMLAIGRALMGGPRLLLLDEPSLGLAPLIVKRIFEIIEAIRQDGTTVLIVEQNAASVLQIADYAYVLETGKITMQGTAKELLNDANLVKAYLGGH